MSLKLMYITNRPDIASIVQQAGVNRIFVDMEYIGKSERQGGMDTVQSFHTAEDVAAIRKVITTSEMLVRCNPMHEETGAYCSSEVEINRIIQNGADIVMLPFFHSPHEVKRFVDIVSGRAKVMLLIETKQAVAQLDEILAITGVDEYHIGLNDLSIAYGNPFMFELLSNGTVEKICQKLKNKGLPYGFGGIASLGCGLLPSEMVIQEHYRLGSTMSILSRSFCNTHNATDLTYIKTQFTEGIAAIRAFERNCELGLCDFEQNKKDVAVVVETICHRIA